MSVDVLIWSRETGAMCACGHPVRDHTRRWFPPFDQCVDGCPCQLVRDPTLLAAGDAE